MAVTVKEVRFEPRKFVEDSRAKLRRALTIVGDEMDRDIKETINRHRPPSYRKMSRLPVSTHDKPPFRRSGDLRRSIKHRVVGTSIVYRWSDMVPYAVYVESGTGRMAKRPFIAPMVSSRWARTRWSQRLLGLMGARI